MSVAILSRHANAWIQSPAYRMAWLALPQSLVLAVAGYLMIAASGSSPSQPVSHWSYPTDSTQHQSDLGAIREKAGVDGDKNAYADLVQRDANGDGMASFEIATLYDPQFAAHYKAWQPKDAAKAISYYKKAEAFTSFALINQAVLMLDPAFNVYDPANGCPYLLGQMDHFKEDAKTSGNGWALLAAADCVRGMQGKYKPLKSITQADELQAIEYVKLALTTNQPSSTIAQRVLGYIYEQGENGIAPDEIEARKYYQLCSEAGEVLCMQRLGILYTLGRGGLVVNYETALGWFQKAADKGDPFSVGNVGVFYEKGLGGLAKNPNKAVELYTKAVEAGDAFAMENLGFAYYNGAGGLKQDFGQAAQMMLRSIDGKNKTALDDLRSNAKNNLAAEFWRGIQKGLLDRKVYNGPADGKPNEKMFDAIGQLVR